MHVLPQTKQTEHASSGTSWMLNTTGQLTCSIEVYHNIKTTTKAPHAAHHFCLMKQLRSSSASSHMGYIRLLHQATPL